MEVGESLRGRGMSDECVMPWIVDVPPRVRIYLNPIPSHHDEVAQEGNREYKKGCKFVGEGHHVATAARQGNR